MALLDRWKAKPLRCSHCGAPLQVSPEATTVRCEFCGTTSVVEGGARPDPRKNPQKTKEPAEPAAEDRRRRRFAVPWTVVTPLIITGFVMFSLMRGAGWIGRSSSAVSAGEPRWQGTGGILLVEVSGDGLPDVIGRMRRVRGEDAISLAAFEGQSGRRLWETPAFGTYSDTYRLPVASTGALLLAADGSGRVFAFDLGGGQKRLEASLGEVVASFCRTDAGEVVAVTRDREKHVLDVTRGKTSLISRETGCTPLPEDGAGSAGGFSKRQHRAHGGPRERPEVPGMDVVDLLPAGTLRLAVGSRKQGTAVALAARVEDDAVTWMTPLASVPLEAEPGAPELAATNAEALFALYEGKQQNDVRLVRLDAADGGRAWDVPVPARTMTVFEEMVATPTRVYVSGWGRLDAFEATTGKHVFRIGD